MGLSVVVACHDVAEFLPACLDSLIAQELSPTQVILVNDGSSDDTGAICESYATNNPGWTVVIGPGSGPGGARELGLRHVTEQYLAFVDGDDVVPPDAFRILIHSLQKTGSDFAAGDVLRYDGVHLTPSGPHRNAILAAKLRTTIRSTPSLMYDTTSWNKVFRTQFWHESDLHFIQRLFRFLQQRIVEHLELLLAERFIGVLRNHGLSCQLARLRRIAGISLDRSGHGFIRHNAGTDFPARPISRDTIGRRALACLAGQGSQFGSYQFTLAVGMNRLQGFALD